MPATDPRIDAYISKAAPFARPILEHIRQLMHKACPEVQETIKWSHPFFEYNGAVLCNMAAFKAHCSFGFWKAAEMKDPEGILQVGEKHSAGHFDRIHSLKDLPSDKILIAYIKEAALLNKGTTKAAGEATKAAPRAPKAPKKEVPVPAELLAALKKNKKAQAAFEAFPPSHRREYNEWIAEAKTEETRQKRVTTTIEWLSEGKSRNWKYQKK